MITEFKGAEPFDGLRSVIDKQCRPFVDLKGYPVKNDAQEWFMDPLK